ncbi:MAG: hypothetical protein AAGC63_13860, partial [Propionicimonas sp.]
VLALAGVVPPGAGAISVTPSQVSIEELRPGTSGVAEVVVTNTGQRAAQVSVTGQLTSEGLVDEDDLLQVDLAGCAQSWTGVPAGTTAIPSAQLGEQACPGGQVPASSGSLPAVPLEAGGTLHLLITAGLGEHAGNGAQGQSWRATFDVQALTHDEPVAVPLAVTGAQATRIAQVAVGLLVVGGAAVVLRSKKRKGTTR